MVMSKRMRWAEHVERMERSENGGFYVKSRRKENIKKT
jgi:hypothetical protein